MSPPSDPAPDGHLAYDTSTLLRPPSLPIEPLELTGLPAGAMVRALRRLPDGRLRAGLVDLPAGWQVDAPLRASGVMQVFVLEGAIEANDRRIEPRGFLAVPRGARLPRLCSRGATRIVLILDADARLGEARETASTTRAEEPELTMITDAMVIEPIVPVIAGRRLEGFERRVLWFDEATGADTRLLRIPAGFEGGGPGWHPVEEEILLLEGDVAPDDTRLLKPGDYLWNPARSVHGFHEHSRTGCLLLEWHDGLWSYNPYRPADTQG
jgi:hypothetical protein